MVTLVLMAVGVAAIAAAWRLVATGHVSIWPAMSGTIGALGLAALATDHVSVSPRLRWPVSALLGLGAGVALYAATAAIVLIVRRWPRFDRHVAAIYDQRQGLALGPALFVAAGVNASGEELFWRGLFQWRLARSLGWPAASGVTWAVYAGVNLFSQNLPIVAGGIVGGAVWVALAFSTHGALASLLCHAVWTGLMLAFPPGGAGVPHASSSRSRTA